ncbi:MAG: hypothetical protein HY716_03380 [Planctomycetes bacterium]|nr:hypothetical protein [Planctomycetota bacterium]
MVIETDVDTFLAGKRDRLRVIATALRGLAHDGDGTGESLEPKVLHAASGELVEIARRLAATLGKLCHRCRLLEVEERVRVR